MTEQEKLKEIQSRIKAKFNLNYDETTISVLMVTGYLNTLNELGVVGGGFTMTAMGKSVMAICEEFDFKPCDQAIIDFIDAATEDHREEFIFMIKRYRDERQKMIEEIKNFKETL
jgi:hypothetical protein